MKQKTNAEIYEKEIKSRLFGLTRQLATKQGFFSYYYKILPKCKTQEAAFDIVNLLHYLLFDEYKYSSYNSFRHVKNKELRKG